jgi:hypothetical protein
MVCALFSEMIFCYDTRTARTSLAICMPMHGTGPPCAGTITGRASRAPRVDIVETRYAVLTPYPHYGSAFVAKMR